MYDKASVKLAAKLGAILQARRQYICTVESCTGGELSALITAVPGSSNWFTFGAITYANSAKINIAGVAKKLIDKHGAVSAEVAEAMAMGGLNLSGTDYAISITGIAGPGGESDDKPVGTVCFAWAGFNEVAVKCMHFSGNRSEVRTKSVQFAMQHMVELLTKS